MQDQSMQRKKFTILVAALVISGLYGCTKNQGYSVLAATGTVIGVEVSQNPATQSPQGKLGYNRGELAFVPTNRNGGKDAGTSHDGARDSANVIMELRYGGIFDLGESSGIYQRLAVGDIAVHEPGAAVMFAKNSDGSIGNDTDKALGAVKSVPLVSGSKLKSMAEISRKYNEYKLQNDTASMNKFHNAVRKIDPAKYSSYGDFSIDTDASLEKIKAVCLLINDQGENLTCD